MFFQTAHGAQLGDIFMSFIHTCELSGVDPFDYLTELQRHAEEVSGNPKDWMPWNYRETVERSRGSPQQCDHAEPSVPNRWMSSDRVRCRSHVKSAM